MSFIYFFTFHFIHTIHSQTFSRNEVFPIVSDGYDCPALYRNITNWGECIYAGELLAESMNYSDSRQLQAPGTGPHGCYWDKGNWYGTSDWLIWNNAPSNQPANPFGRQIICQSEYVEGNADGSCPESFAKITQSSTCSTSATYLGLTETTPVDTDVAHKNNRPLGCYHNVGSNGLYFNDNSATNFVADSQNYVICRKKYAVRLFALDLVFATSIIYNGESRYLLAGTSWKTLDWLDPGESFTVTYNPVGQPQVCTFHHFDQSDILTLTKEISIEIPSVTTVNLYCVTPEPSFYPTNAPSTDPTFYPTLNPTSMPTMFPSMDPIISPTMNPTITPTQPPTSAPSKAPSATPCSLRSSNDCTPGNGPYCYFDSETNSCSDLPACPATGTISCDSYCGREVDRCAVAPLNSTHMCSCELCGGVTNCDNLRTELLRFDGDYNAMFPTNTRNETEEQFLTECSTALSPVECTSVFAGSIYLEIRGETEAVDAAVDDIQRNGLTMPSFGRLSLLGSVRSLTSGGDDDDGFGAIWIALIVVGVCLCILIGCFFRHRGKTHHNYQGGATPRPDKAVLEMDGKTLSYSEANV